jgi:hypothetical protein
MGFNPMTSQARYFLFLSAAYWACIALISAIWAPVFQWMKLIIQMESEYSLLEQGGKLVLLVMLFGSLFAYSNRKKVEDVRLSIMFILFALTLYFAESNFILNELQPIFGAFFIVLICWKLLNVDWIALAFMVVGSALVFLGVVTDLLMDKPMLFPRTEFFDAWARRAGLIEEQFDLWGIACIVYASLVAFRVNATGIFFGHFSSLMLLIMSLALIASGNSFAHWSHNPSPIFEIIATTMAVVGVIGVLSFDRHIQARGFRVSYFQEEGFYVGFVVLFVVLPIVYGRTGIAFNLLLWLAFLFYLYNLLLRSHPSTHIKSLAKS